jgi:prolyl 4-hydroxylase
MFSPKIVENFLTKDDCQYLIDVATSIEKWETGGNEFWDNRSLNAVNIYNNVDKMAGRLLYVIREKIGEAIKEQYKLDHDVYPDLCQIVRWFPGQEQHPHADDMKNTQGNDWFHHREYGAILYLNDNYSGGHTYYPNHNFDIKPKTGTLAIHLGDEEHLHGVTKVENNMRYTIASFWTTDKEYFDGWTLS